MFIFYSDNDQGDTLPVGSTNDLFNIIDPAIGEILAYDGSHFTNTNILSGSSIDLINIDPSNLTGIIPYSKIPDFNADKITSGTIDSARLPALYFSGTESSAPYVSAIAPSITSSGSQNITITGDNFTPNTTVTIPGATISNLVVCSPQKITFTIDKSNLSRLIAVTIANGTNTNQVWAEGIKNIDIINDPHFASVVFFLKRSLVDSSPSPQNINISGSVAISTEQSKYSGNSIKFFNSLSNHLVIPANSGFIFPADFTVEAWIRWDGIETNGGAVLIATGGAGSQDQLGIFSGGLLGYGTLSNPFAISANTWHHIAISRSAGTVRGFLNGTQRYSITNTSSIGSSTNALYIGRRSDNHPWGGFVDSLRITKGVGRYTANFNPETDTYLNV